jgi:hypothetical protein
VAAAAASRSREPSGLAANSDEEEAKADGGRTRDDKYREFCEGMRTLLETYPHEQKRMGGGS